MNKSVGKKGRECKKEIKKIVSIQIKVQIVRKDIYMTYEILVEALTRQLRIYRVLGYRKLNDCGHAVK